MTSFAAAGAALFPWLAGMLAEGLGIWIVLPYVMALLIALLGLWIVFRRLGGRATRTAEQPSADLGVASRS